MRRIGPTVGLLGALVCAVPVWAQDARVDVHGYGTWAFGRTPNDNIYLYGVKGGDYRYMAFAVNLSVGLGDRLRIDAQPDWTTDADAAIEADLDFAFAEWTFSDRLKLRVGRVKQPFGLYTEIFAVGTVRPFLSLPQSVYGGTGFAGESYQGLGLTGAVYAKNGWGLAYDLYGGGMELTEVAGPIDYLIEGSSAVQGKERESTRDVIGAHAMVHTPIEGLSVGASSYTGTMAEDHGARRTVSAVQAEYLSNAWSVRSEVARESTMEFTDTHMLVLGGYVEIGYRLTQRWQTAALYDRLYTVLENIDISAAPSLLQHTTWGAGLNYWFSPNFVLKGSLHLVRGNRYAFPAPEALGEIVESGRLKPRTSLLMFGGQLSF